MTDPSNAVERTRKALDAVEADDSFVFLVGDENGVACNLHSGDHEPTGVHVHLLATHIRALADLTGADPENVAIEALNTLDRMDASGALTVSERLDTKGEP